MSDVASKMADAVKGFGGVLRCQVCGLERKLIEIKAAEYLRHGWPKHHGQTMRWITDKQLAKKETL